MARTYARLVTSVWDNVDGNDFCDLSSEAQRVYFLLLTQSEISAVGRLRLTVRAWAAMSSNNNVKEVSAGLSELVEKRYVLADKTTEEVLVRTFVRHDGGYANRKRIPVIRAAVKEIRSRELRAAAIAECAKVGLAMGDGPDGGTYATSDSPPDSLSGSDGAEVASRVNGKPVGAPNPASSQVDTLSDRASAADADAQTLSDRVVEVQVVGKNPQPSTRNQTSSCTPPKRATDRGTRIAEPFTITDQMRTWASQKAPLVDIDFETEQFVDYWVAKPGAIAHKLDWTRTWQTWMRRVQQQRQESAPSNVVQFRGQARSTTDERVAQALAAGAAVQAELDAMGGVS